MISHVISHMISHVMSHVIFLLRPLLLQLVVYQLQLLNTWGDPYYIGLNGIQLFDIRGDPISLTSNSEYNIQS